MLPSGGPRGQTTRLRMDGKSLAGAALHVSGGGIAVKSVQVSPGGDALTADLDVQAGARLGPHEIRVTTPKGVSSGMRFWVDVMPNRVLEQTLPESAMPIELDGATPVVFNGRIAGKVGRDRFALTASGGDTWTFDCFADRIRSRFDPVLELKDAAGVSVQLAESTWESDPHLCCTFAKAGRYFLTVRDSEFNGGPNYTYRLAAGRMGYIAGFSPRGGQPGKTLDMTLLGTNVPASHVTVALPANAPFGPYWADVPTGNGHALLPLLVGAEPVLDAGSGETVRALPALPANVDGVFARSPRARFTFHAASGSKILFDLLGRRLGSRIDGEIRILDGAGKEIAANDDAPGLGKDARLEFGAPAEGNYTVEVHNVEDVIGADCGYRLEARPVVPDFRLAIETDRLTVPLGGTIALPVTLERVGGFAGAVRVRADNLPPGVTCAGGLISPDQTTTEITLTTAPNAAFAASDVHIIGAATIGNKTVAREAPAWERYEHRSIDLSLSVEYSYTRPHHLWDMLLLAVTERADPITVAHGLSGLTLAPGGTMDIPIHITRQPNAKGEIKLDARHLPPKVTLTAAPIPDGQTEGKITLSAAPDAPLRAADIIVQAHLGNAVALTPAISLSVEKK